MTKLRSYVLPTSAAWWASFASLLLGGMMVWFPGDETLARVAIIYGAIINVQDASGLGFITFGVLGIGLRAKLERVFPERDLDW